MPYGERPAEAGMKPPAGSKRDRYGDASAEAIDGSDMAQRIHRRAPWKTRKSAEPAALE